MNRGEWSLAAASEIADAAALARASGRLGIDTEFMSEGRYRALLCLVQIVVDDPSAENGIRIDLIDGLGDADVTPLAELLADPAVEIVLHAGRQDVAILRRAWATQLTNLFDTQLAAGFAGASAQAGYGNLIGAILGAARRQDRKLHALGCPTADLRAAQLRGRRCRPPARAGRRITTASARDRQARLGTRGVPPARVRHGRARPGDGLGAPAASQPARPPCPRGRA